LATCTASAEKNELKARRSPSGARANCPSSNSLMTCGQSRRGSNTVCPSMGNDPFSAAEVMVCGRISSDSPQSGQLPSGNSWRERPGERIHKALRLSTPPPRFDTYMTDAKWMCVKHSGLKGTRCRNTPTSIPTSSPLPRLSKLLKMALAALS